jgi:hypothetical protein
MTRGLFPATVQAVCATAIAVHCRREPAATAGDVEAVSRFVLEQHGRMPDWARPAIVALAWVFTWQSVLTSGRFYHRRPAAARERQLAGWRNSALGFRRNFARLFESLSVFGWYSLTPGEAAA